MKRVISLIVAFVMTLSLVQINFTSVSVEAATAGDGTYIWPVSVSYGITKSYTKAHGGFDLGSPIGSSVYAVASGTVVKAQDFGCGGSHGAANGRCPKENSCSAYTSLGNNGSYANWIIIDHGQGVYSLYAHLQTGSFKVSAGQTVSQGQEIAKSGNAGNTAGNTGAHLHFELRMGANSISNGVDPLSYLTKTNTPSIQSPSSNQGPIQSAGYVTHLDSPIGTYAGYNHIELKGWIACNTLPSFVMAEISGVKQYNLDISISPSESYPGYAYFVRFYTVINIADLNSYRSYNLNIWSSLGHVWAATFNTGDIQPPKYTTSYNANGGYNAPSADVVIAGGKMIVSEVIPQRTGYTFLGWSQSSSATSPTYTPGEQFTPSSNVTLYAVWKRGCPDAHDYRYSVATAPTASSTGSLIGTCSKCSGTTSVTLPKLNASDYSYSVTKDNSCTETGMERYTWKTTTYGSFYFDVLIAASGHAYSDKITAPTCTEKGYTTHTCLCGHSYIDTYTNVIEHNYKYAVEKEPTDSEKGVLAGECSMCSSDITHSIPKLNEKDYMRVIIKDTAESITYRYVWNSSYGSYHFDVTLDKLPEEEKPDENATQIVVDNVTGMAGETVTVIVNLKNNPGFGGMAYTIGYDNTILELISYELGLGSTICTDSGIDTYPNKINFQYAGVSNITGDGALVTLTFKIKDSAVIGTTTITVTPEEGTSFYYEGRTEIDFELFAVDGMVEIIEYIKGDINGDGKVNNRDAARLMQYLAGWDVDYVSAALDVNGDNKINNRDAARLMQYLAGWDVEIN